jgi:hypothetical protein
MNLENHCSCAGHEFSAHFRLATAGFKAESRLHFASATSLSVSEKSQSNAMRREAFLRWFGLPSRSIQKTCQRKAE